MICPECEETVVNQKPSVGIVPQMNWNDSLPEWSHRDGMPLCPVMREGGYEPAFPVEY